MGMPFGLTLGVSPSLEKLCFIHLGASCITLTPHRIYNLSSRHFICTFILSKSHKMGWWMFGVMLKQSSADYSGI